jgi:hypothetical protein
MPISTAPDNVHVSPADGHPRVHDQERAELLASLEESRADIAAGRYDVLTPGMLRCEFEAILDNDPSDEALDALLGIASR